ncbi:hypothetical protein Leryth_002126 [Lithospermum erythrorhizon]|nr:hypothetical protein Leryth_002126 [Lithospermum erythrorhizon]
MLCFITSFHLCRCKMLNQDKLFLAVGRTADISRMRFIDVYCNHPSQSDQFVEFVNQTINLRGSSKIKTFKIKFFLNRSYRIYLDFWIQYALANGVEELLLTFIGKEVT